MSWVKEKTIHTFVWEHCLKKISKSKFYAYSEYEISDYNHRPDIIMFNKRHVDIVEIKITANLETIGQLFKYVSIVNKELPRPVKIKKHIVARYWDVSILPFVHTAKELGIVFWQFNYNEKENSAHIEELEIPFVINGSSFLIDKLYSNYVPVGDK
jgi:hypothetical protein